MSDNEAHQDRFESAYTTGIVEEPVGAREVAEDAVGPPRAMLAAQEPFALRGCVLTPTRKIEDGCVVVGGDGISEVSEGEPDSLIQVIDTRGVILPALIDLHGHPEYNVFSAWEPPKLYEDRYQWRGSYEYQRVIKTPWNDLTMKEPSRLRELTRYAEVRSLVGGVTAIQGASSKYPDKEEALVRNVDLPIFGQDRARSMIDLSSDDAERVGAALDSGEISTFYVHLAEGVNDKSREELDALVGYGLLREETVIIHGTALTEEQLGQVHEAGAKLVWSPQSNLRLYGQTTRAADALSLGIPVGIGADWLPSGSPSLLAELKVARRTLSLQGADITSERLVEMVTSEPARIAKLEDYVGTLEKGRVADILVLERRREDPWENVVEADPSWVELVTIGGNPVYGRPDLMTKLANDTDRLKQAEKVCAWGKPMLLDTSYSVAKPAETPPTLVQLRAILIDRFPQVGPIFA